jgi:hypothetical protein
MTDMKISDIIIREDLYPRMEIDAKKIQEYSENIDRLPMPNRLKGGNGMCDICIGICKNTEKTFGHKVDPQELAELIERSPL